jgi:hypothetical protein
MGSEGQFVKSDGSRTSPASKRDLAATQIRPFTGKPLDGKEGGRRSAFAGAKRPTEFPASVTQPSIYSADVDLSFAEVAANGRAAGPCEPSQPLTQLALSALSRPWQGSAIPPCSFTRPAIRASRSISKGPMTAVRTKPPSNTNARMAAIAIFRSP